MHWRAVKDSELPFIKKMLQRRHILIHNGAVVDEDYLRLSGDNQVRLSCAASMKGSKAADNFLKNSYAERCE